MFALSWISWILRNVGQNSRLFVAQPPAKRASRFIKRYSAQLSFTLLVIIFLTVTVGEGQAYGVDTPKLAAQIELQNDGFLGKPQVFSGETVLTGEVQQFAEIVYRVESGDSIISIAKRYNLSVGTILDHNNISATNSEKIAVGTELLIPAEDTNTSLAWLSELNRVKEEERARAEAARQKELARQERNRLSRITTTRSVPSNFSGNYRIIGTMWGQYNGGYPGQCTWYVNYIRPDLPNGMGNGGQYLANARAKGLPTGSIPRVNAVIVSRESRWGHVEVVVSVNGDRIVTRGMNYAGAGIITERNRHVNEGNIIGYIY